MIPSCANHGIYCALQMSGTKSKQRELECQISGEGDPQTNLPFLFFSSGEEHGEGRGQLEVVSSPLLACTFGGLNLGPQAL